VRRCGEIGIAARRASSSQRPTPDNFQNDNRVQNQLELRIITSPEGPAAGDDHLGRAVSADQRARNVVPAMIADLGDEAPALCRILHRQYPQPAHPTGLCPSLQPVLRLV
jgi:hypothetical protein